ncbi:unnamed protein product [Hermetia illucens]|uniref:Phosphatidylinositol N-acetylglucosaminyltransferase subunit H conserved domain-containing protein n=1 Tax=Hermetia illucens TaxID=343691 RepID=A0A7R8YT61_HERIL|nr:phosphatidylinositol N-acetylglucosaminyltransferase subunit H [Hermetia illucens]CAD7084199.1 unnamed protein product [Hermetia illucens]
MTCIKETHHTTAGKPLLLEIAELNPDNILVTITNQSYWEDKLSYFKYTLLLSGIYAFYKLTIATKLLIDVCLLGALLLVIYFLFNVVQFESLTFINEFGVQTSTRYFLGLKSSMFIPTSDIHDVVINEVICDLKVIYFLIIRTKGRLYKTKPIIPLFDGLRPSIDCLEPIYKVLYKKFDTE